MTVALRQRPLTQVVNSIVKAVNGCWLDPSDMSTMFQDAAGTTPVTAVGQPVGLILDKSQGLMLGPELVTNGDFSNGTAGWTLGTGWSVTTGSATFTGAVAGKLQQNNILTIGRMYRIQFNTTITSQYIGLLSESLVPQTLIGQSGYKVLYLTATSPAFSIYAGANANVLIDNISVREIYGNHATQSVTASRPTLSARYNLLTKTDDFADAAWAKIGCSVTKNTQTAPDGTLTADTITATGTDVPYVEQDIYTTQTSFYESFFVKGVGSTIGKRVKMYFVRDSYVQVLSSTTVTLTGDYQQVQFQGTFSTAPASFIRSRIDFGESGNVAVGDSVVIWGANCNFGSTLLPYQRVNTATDYDTDPRYFPKYLKFDGVDDYLNLPFMSLYGGGAASIIAARNTVSQATDTYIISERSTSNANPKYFPSRQLAGGGNMDSYISDDTAAVVLDTIGSAFSGASDKVIRSVVDTGDNIKLFKNGVLAADDNYTRAGTLTLNNTTIGASVSTTTSNYASMKLYGLIVTKSALTDAQRVRCERFLARKAGVML